MQPNLAVFKHYLMNTSITCSDMYVPVSEVLLQNELANANTPKHTVRFFISCLRNITLAAHQLTLDVCFLEQIYVTDKSQCTPDDVTYETKLIRDCLGRYRELADLKHKRVPKDFNPASLEHQYYIIFVTRMIQICWLELHFCKAFIWEASNWYSLFLKCKVYESIHLNIYVVYSAK